MYRFNAGSALAANLRAVMAAMVTNLSASIGGVTWCLIDFRLEKKWSVVGFCSGVVAGLVCITPGSGFVPPWSAVVYGVLAGAGCNYATKLKFYLQCDDALDIFAVHGVGGIIGNLLTGLFAADYIAHLDGSTIIQGGWVNQNYRQLGIQLADTVAGAAWSFAVSAIILYAMKLLGIYLPMFRLRASAEEEELGIDDVEIGEFAVSALINQTVIALLTNLSTIMSRSTETSKPCRWTRRRKHCSRGRSLPRRWNTNNRSCHLA